MRVDYTILRIDDHSGRKSMLAEGTAEPVARPAMGEVNHFRGKSRHFPSDRIVIRDFCVNSHHDQQTIKKYGKKNRTHHRCHKRYRRGLRQKVRRRRI